MSARRKFRELQGGETFRVGENQITARWLNHPQGCLGFRIEASAGTIAYATDNEPGHPALDKSLRELGDYLRRTKDVHRRKDYFGCLVRASISAVRKYAAHCFFLQSVAVLPQRIFDLTDRFRPITLLRVIFLDLVHQHLG
jgi:hypothetical protein